MLSNNQVCCEVITPSELNSLEECHALCIFMLRQAHHVRVIFNDAELDSAYYGKGKN
jgi:hypothetical protein